MTFGEKPAVDGRRLAVGGVSLAVLLLACGGGSGGGGGASSSGGSGSGSSPTGDNVLQVTVDGALCAAATSQGYPNKPCVEVKICEPGSSTCQVIDDVLLDTGSNGLRVFRQALGALGLGQIASGSGGLAECAQFLDSSSDWGPVEVADVVLGNETASSVPVHVLDASYSIPPPGCSSPEKTPSDAGFNGILGVGVFPQDCGAGCAGDANSANGVYFSCGATGCTQAAAPIEDQVQNPVAMLPTDNNGVIVELPSVGATGTASVSGYLVLGIGTRTNNSISGLTVFPVDPNDGTFSTEVSGETLLGSFLDTGSNGLFFAAPSGAGLSDCTDNAAWYCPPSAVSLRAVNTAYQAQSGATVSFEVGNFTTLTGTGGEVFPDLGGSAFAGSGFDWGLPFYLGRRVAIGVSDTAPYVAYSP
jgi:hypothetical protein